MKRIKVNLTDGDGFYWLTTIQKNGGYKLVSILEYGPPTIPDRHLHDAVRWVLEQYPQVKNINIENVPDKITWTVFCTKSKKERFYAYRLGGKIMGTFLYSHATKFKTKELNKVVNEVKELYPGYNIQCNLVDL